MAFKYMQKHSILIQEMYFCVYMHIYFHIMWICYLLKNKTKKKGNKNLTEILQDLSVLWHSF